MGWNFKKSLRLGPLQANLTKRGLSSLTLRFGRVSVNSRTRRATVDTPGPGSWTSPHIGRKRKGRKS